MYIEQLGVFFVGCQYALDRDPAIYEAARAARWIDQGAAAVTLRNAPHALLEAAMEFSNGRIQGTLDRDKEERKKGGK